MKLDSFHCWFCGFLGFVKRKPSFKLLRVYRKLGGLRVKAVMKVRASKSTSNAAFTEHGKTILIKTCLTKIHWNEIYFVFTS